MFNDLEKTVDKFMTACDEATEDLRWQRELKLVMQQRKSNKIAIRKAKLKMTSMGGYTRT